MLTPRLNGSTIQFRRDDINASQNRHHIRNHVAFDQFGESLIVDITRRPGANAPRHVFAGRYDVITQLPVAAFDATVNLTLGGCKSPVGHDQFEMLDESFNTAINLVLWRKDFFALWADI